jgi:hypothetical protein
MKANNSNNGEGEEQQQPKLRRSARKRKLNPLANGGKPTGGEEDQPKLADCNSKTKREEKKDQDLEVCTLEIGLKLKESGNYQHQGCAETTMNIGSDFSKYQMSFRISNGKKSEF